MVIFPYCAYMLAESLHLSGIVAILFCGIVMAHYTRRNLSKVVLTGNKAGSDCNHDSSPPLLARFPLNCQYFPLCLWFQAAHHNLLSFFKILASLAETFVFIYMGVAMFLEEQVTIRSPSFLCR